MSRAPRQLFKVPSLSSTEETGWGGRLSRWQWAIAIGLPVAAAATLAGLTYFVLRRRSRHQIRGRTPPPDMSPTPVATPTSTTATANSESQGPVTAQGVKQRGNGLFKQGKLEEAAQCYREAIELGAGDSSLIASCHQNLAAVHTELAKKATDDELKNLHSQLVIDHCDKAIALDSRYVKALLRRFKMHQSLGNQEEALLDVTRVLLLDESHAQSLSSSVTSLLKDLSLSDATKNFPSLGPLAPTKYLVKTYTESYIWKDDISEERLKKLWLEVHPPLVVSQPTPTTSDGDRSTVDTEKEETESPVVVTGIRVVEGEGEEGGAAGGDGEEKDEKKVENGGGEEGEVEKEAEEGEEGTDNERKDVGESNEGKNEGENQENGEVENTDPLSEESQMNESMAGFSDEPFVKAAEQFGRYELTGILDLLTQAINTGHVVFKSHALLLRGTLQALWRMESEALRDLQEVINTQGLPNEMYMNALIKKAGIFSGQQNMDKCKTCLEKAQTICPDAVDILVHRARVYLEAEVVNNLDSVVEDLSKAVEKAPDQPYPIYSLASSFHRLASISQSMQLIETARFKFQEALKRFPNFADGLILYALFLQDTGDFPQAEQILNKAVQVEPDNPLGYFSLGLLTLVTKSDIDQTMVYMQKAIGVDISCVQAYDTIASIEMQRGNTAKAMELYNKAVSYSRNQVEMTQAYVAQKVFSMQDRVCKEYGVSIQQLAARAAAAGPSGPIAI